MITVNELAAQGDLLFRRIDHLPGDVEPTSAERIIVGHSETGHHHVVDGPGARLYERRERDPFVCFLVVYEAFADVQHLRSYDTHETLRLPRGFWEVRRQREWVPEGFFYTLARD